MFIEWLKDVMGIYWEIVGDLIKWVFGFWALLSWIMWLADFFPQNKELTEAGKFFHDAAVPFMVVTGVVPSLIVLGFWGIRKCRYLYLDYRYFVANGGKRKREETATYDPYQEDMNQ